MSPEEEQGLDRTELEQRVTLMTEYGHSYGMASLLARYGRDLQRESLEKHSSLIIVTGI